MKKLNWKVFFGLILLASSAVLYYLQFTVFHDIRDTSFYLFQDIAFVPIQILIVTVIVDQLLGSRERKALLHKMNMVIGAFYSECGTEVIKSFLSFEKNCSGYRSLLLVSSKWKDKDFRSAKIETKGFNFCFDYSQAQLEQLKDLLANKRGFLLRLLENPNLLEHDTFTDLLWAVFHLAEELDYRKDLTSLSKADRDHIAGDMRRSYSLLIFEWLSYMQHLKRSYPFLFSLAVRMNPFDPNSRADIE